MWCAHGLSLLVYVGPLGCFQWRCFPCGAGCLVGHGWMCRFGERQIDAPYLLLLAPLGTRGRNHLGSSKENPALSFSRCEGQSASERHKWPWGEWAGGRVRCSSEACGRRARGCAHPILSLARQAHRSRRGGAGKPQQELRSTGVLFTARLWCEQYGLHHACEPCGGREVSAPCVRASHPPLCPASALMAPLVLTRARPSFDD